MSSGRVAEYPARIGDRVDDDLFGIVLDRLPVPLHRRPAE